MEFTQPLGVGLGLSVSINNQYSHPVYAGQRTDAYATINNMWEISQNTSYLLSNIYMGVGKIMGTGYCVDDVQAMQTVKSQLMTSQ